jgi:hypothetical protein
LFFGCLFRLGSGHSPVNCQSAAAVPEHTSTMITPYIGS